jgi:hypothetical protein
VGFTGLQSLAVAKPSLRGRTVDASVATFGMVVGALVDGASGAAWGLAVAGIIRVVSWWRQFYCALRDRDMSLQAVGSPAYTLVA